MTHTFSPEKVAGQRAVALITSFCQAISTEEIDPTYGETFFDIAEEVATDPAPDTTEKVLIALVSIICGLLDYCEIDANRFDILAGLAHDLYGGIQ